MSELVRAAYETAGAILLLAGVVIGQASNIDVPGAEWITAGAGLIGIVAIGQMVRAIASTETQKTEVIDALQKQLAQLTEENRLLREEIHDLLSPN